VATELIVGKSGKVEERQLTVVRAVGDQWLVGSGLAAGDRVIIEGLQKVQPGATVQAKEAITPAPVPAAASGAAQLPAG
jgi:membrane fusion protein (multidrug efflux system)